MEVSVPLDNGKRLKIPVLATALCEKDLYGVDHKKHQIKVFNSGQEYPVTRIKPHYLIVINNNNEEHFVLEGNWMESFKIVKRYEQRKNETA